MLGTRGRCDSRSTSSGRNRPSRRGSRSRPGRSHVDDRLFWPCPSPRNSPGSGAATLGGILLLSAEDLLVRKDRDARAHDWYAGGRVREVMTRIGGPVPPTPGPPQSGGPAPGLEWGGCTDSTRGRRAVQGLCVVPSPGESPVPVRVTGRAGAAGRHIVASRECASDGVATFGRRPLQDRGSRFACGQRILAAAARGRPPRGRRDSAMGA